MNDQDETNEPAAVASISEADRMAKIRELLVGPVIADESARVDQTVERLNDFIKKQQESIDALQIRIADLEESHRSGMSRLRLRLLGMVEALITDEEDVRSRIMRNKTLNSELDDGQRRKGT